MASVIPKYVSSRSSVAAKQSLNQGADASPRKMPNNTLQGTFDPRPIFAIAKTYLASNAPERGR